MPAEYVTPHPDVVFTDLGKEGIIMHSISGEAFRLNSSGVLLWRACPAHMDALAQLLIEKWSLSKEQATADADAWLAALSAKGLVQVTSSSDAE